MRAVLRRLAPWAGGTLLLAFVAAGAWQWLGGAHAPAGLPGVAATVGGPFRLTDEEGRVVTEETWRGRFVLLYFGYRYCPDVCPTELARMVEAYDLLPAAIQAQLVIAFATVDPERDHAAALRDYTDLFHPALIGLTGTQAETDAAARAFRVFHRRVSEGRDADAYLLDHSSFTYLLGPDGRTRQVYPPTLTAEALAADLLRQTSPALAHRRLP
jgi:protein SCO1/2